MTYYLIDTRNINFFKSFRFGLIQELRDFTKTGKRLSFINIRSRLHPGVYIYSDRYSYILENQCSGLYQNIEHHWQIRCKYFYINPANHWEIRCKYFYINPANRFKECASICNERRKMYHRNRAATVIQRTWKRYADNPYSKLGRKLINNSFPDDFKKVCV